MRILSGTSLVDFDDLTCPAGDYNLEGPEDQLREIIIVAYEAALEAGMEPAQALAVLESWVVSERLRCEDQTESSTGEQYTMSGFLQAA
jgi:hypothetical protein